MKGEQMSRCAGERMELGSEIRGPGTESREPDNDDVSCQSCVSDANNGANEQLFRSMDRIHRITTTYPAYPDYPVYPM